MCDVQCVASSSQDCEIVAVECGPGEGPVPVLDGSQPSERPCGRFSGKRKLNEEDVVKNPRATGKPAIHLKPSERPCRRFWGKRKLNEEDVVKHPVRTKQPEPLNEPDSDSD